MAAFGKSEHNINLLSFVIERQWLLTLQRCKAHMSWSTIKLWLPSIIENSIFLFGPEGLTS